MNPVMIAYICDQRKDCGRFSHCQKDCFHTFNGLFAKNGVIKDASELKTSRFELVVVANETTYYKEVL